MVAGSLIDQFNNNGGVAEMTSLDQLIATMMNVSGVGIPADHGRRGLPTVL